MVAVRSVRCKPQSLQFVQTIYSASHQIKYTCNIVVMKFKISLLQECRFLGHDAMYSGRSLSTFFLGKGVILLYGKSSSS